MYVNLWESHASVSTIQRSRSSRKKLLATGRIIMKGKRQGHREKEGRLLFIKPKVSLSSSIEETFSPSVVAVMEERIFLVVVVHLY